MSEGVVLLACERHAQVLQLAMILINGLKMLHLNPRSKAL
jgi:hypothetical protein